MAIVSANTIYRKYIAALEDSTRPGKGENQPRRLTLKSPSRLREWNFDFFAKLGTSNHYGYTVYCNCKSLKDRRRLEKRNYLWDLCWFHEGKRNNLVLTLEQEFVDSPGNPKHWDWFLDDFAKVLLVTTQQCGVFIGNVPPKSERKVEKIIKNLNGYYQEYGPRSQHTDILVILVTQKRKQKGGLLAVRGWKLQKEDDAKELQEKTFEYDGQI